MENRKIKQTKKKKFAAYLVLVLFIIFSAIYVMEIIIEPESYVSPTYDKIDLNNILSKKTLLEDDYKQLFYQTGLGKIAIDEMLKNKQAGIAEILEFQNNFFADKNILCEKIGIVTSQESFVDNEGAYQYGFDLANYENGYVLITKATHSLGWRHGHAAIITDADKGETLEAVILGENTQFQNTNKWRMYPSFIMLKLKNTSDEKLNEIANFSKRNMDDMPYGLTIGLLSKKNTELINIKRTQ